MQALPAFDTLLRRARRAADLTQEQLAERAGLSARVISDLERGVIRAPRPDTLDLLATALGLDDSERALWERMRRRLAQRSPSTAIASNASLAVDRSNLPQPLTPLIGRQREADEATSLLRRQGSRLLTLTGPGGIGKTRLALEVAGVVRTDYPAGAVFVNLAPISDPANVLPAIAAALGVKETAARTLHEDLALTLRDRSMLVVLDNVEQVIDAAGDVAVLLAACPRLAFLATSRIPLHIQGEQLYPVPPLALPDTSAPVDPDQLLRSGAAVLFAQRAQAVKPDFLVTVENAQSIAEICARLDGLPLAIELAAARVSVLAPRAMLQRLDQRLDFLTGGARDLPERQRTLRDAIRWSYELLEPGEQNLLRQVSVFSGGWTLEAAETVVHVADRSGPDVLDGLFALCDKSLLQSVANTDEEPRFGMLETIREFAWDELDTSGEAGETRDRHASCFLQLAEASRSHIDSGDDPAWVVLVEREYDNLRAALTWLRVSGATEHGLAICAALGPFWFARGYITEGRAQLDWFLGQPGALPQTTNRAAALTRYAWFTSWQIDFRESLDAAEEALSIWLEIGDRASVPETLVVLGIAAYSLGDTDRSRSTWLECAQLARSVGDWLSLTRTLNNLSVLAIDDGRNDEALQLLQDSLTVSEEYGIQQGAALALTNLGFMASERGDTVHGERQVQRSLRLYDGLREMAGIASCLSALADIAIMQGLPVRATRLTAAADTLLRQMNLVNNPQNSVGIDQNVAALRATLGDEFQVVWEQGAALTVPDAVAEALSESSEG